jgi:drug/metabolite transporter (DMT)-like permease
MAPGNARHTAGRGEAAGFAASAAFAGLASVRDVYLGGLFQRVSPLEVALIAFTLCALVFLPIAAIRHRGGLRALLSRPGDLFWINVTSAAAWIAYFFALRTIEPSLAQILFSAMGPLSVTWLDRLVLGAPPPERVGWLERRLHLGFLASVMGTSAIVIAGFSATPGGPAVASTGVALAVGAGVSISANTVLCKRLNDGGVAPSALVSMRFVGAALLAGALLLVWPGREPASSASPGAVAAVGAASLALIVFPIYVNQVGISLASPLTVRVVLAATPALVFVFQLADGRLSPSLYSLGAALVYGVLAIALAAARHRQILGGSRGGRLRLS